MLSSSRTSLRASAVERCTSPPFPRLQTRRRRQPRSAQAVARSQAIGARYWGREWICQRCRQPHHPKSISGSWKRSRERIRASTRGGEASRRLQARPCATVQTRAARIGQASRMLASPTKSSIAETSEFFRAELAAYVAKTSRDRPRSWAYVQRLQYACIYENPVSVAGLAEAMTALRGTR